MMVGCQRQRHECPPVFPVSLTIDSVLLGRRDGPRLFAGRVAGGQVFLVAQVPCAGEARRWLCAPTSDVAIGCVFSGRAAPADVFRHSSSGTVEDITLHSDGRITESVHLCAELNDPGLLSDLTGTQLSHLMEC